MTIMGNELLRGELVYLSTFEKNDLDQVVKWFSDLEVLYYMYADAIMPADPEAFSKWLDELAEKKLPELAIYTIAEDNLIGGIFYKDQDARNRSAELVVYIGERSHWGKGFGTDATRVMLRYGFMEMNLHRVQLQVLGYNQRAIASYEKVGFVHEGSRRQLIMRDGKYVDMHVMSMLREEWRERYQSEA